MWIGASINERKGAYCLAAGNGTRIVETFRHIGKDLKYAYGLVKKKRNLDFSLFITYIKI